MKVLIVEDEKAFREVLVGQMSKEGISVSAAGTLAEGLDALDGETFDVVVTDLRLPDGEGIDVVHRLRERGVETPVLLMTAYASVNTAVSALHAGVADYLIKPVRVPDLIHRVKQIFEFDNLKRENRLLRRIVQQEPSRYWFPDTPLGQNIKQLLSKVSRTDLTVLITGESGTGKGMTARLIHSLSTRGDRPFVPVNCGAIPETLIESELFGHVKGAFTGADKAKEGLFVSANGGTLFLDEIGDLPLGMQVKLLHAIEEKTVRPLGGNHSREIDVRIICATNRNLEEMVQEGSFRADLYYRLNVFEITLPPLRDQMSAFPDAVEFILNRYRNQYNLHNLRLDSDAERLMLAYEWPGNLRELENVLERAVLLCEGEVITKWDLPPSINKHVLQAPGGGKSAAPKTDLAGGSLREQVAAFERQLILRAIEECGGDRKAAAKKLGLGLSTLYRKLEDA